MPVCAILVDGVDIRYLELWQSADIRCSVTENIRRYPYRWYMYSISDRKKAEKPELPCSKSNSTRICWKLSGTDGYYLHFGSVRARDHGIRYICTTPTEKPSSYYVDISVYGGTFEKVPAYLLLTSQSLEVWSSIVSSAHSGSDIDVYNSTYAEFHRELRQLVIRIRCHIWAVIRPFRLMWLREDEQGNLEFVDRKCSVLSPQTGVQKPFSTTPLVWRGHALAQVELWSDLIIPMSSPFQELAKYVCRIKWTDSHDGPESDVRKVLVSNS
jgi:hypothetical protein